MHKRRVATTLIVTGTFCLGFAATQIAGATPSFAAAKSHTTTKTHVTRAHPKNAGGTKHAAGPATPHADGTITGISADGDTLTVKPDTDPTGSTEYSKVTTVILGNSTKYPAAKGATTTTKPTFAVGQQFVAEGTLSNSDTTLTATLILVHTAGKGHPGPGHGKAGPGVAGAITAISTDGNTLTVTPVAHGPKAAAVSKITTIVLTSTTQYGRGKGGASTAKPTIAVGNFVMAEGTLSSDGTTLTATHVFISATAPGKH